ncbi:MAG TPA: hypothetical protein PLV33_10310 [Opitutaceae bacterium]|nr:MAG: hypothetical protein BWX86_01874 [Verrucomicrobia bacterium ADurb.Bin122]HOF10376.1 hypothetical protein [Opitutaceae bacterium]
MLDHREVEYLGTRFFQRLVHRLRHPHVETHACEQERQLAARLGVAMYDEQLFNVFHVLNGKSNFSHASGYRHRMPDAF